ncbi:MAG TPA: TMEM175 family protein [Pseudonocardiaceae bacterium]
MSRWWGAGTDRGDTERLEAFSDGVLAIAITLLILDVRVEVPAGTSLAAALGHALPEIGAYAASFLQIGIIWANHHALFRVVDRVDQLMLLFNLLLLGFVAFVPLPTRLVAEHTTGADARTASLLYGATLTGAAIAFNLIWHHLVRADLLVTGVRPEFVRDVTIRYLLGLAGYAAATLLALILPLLTVLVSVLLALMFALGPSLRPALG